jgi:hypothetical protein
MKLDIGIPNPFNKKVDIYLDGVKQTSVIKVDEEAGTLTRYTGVLYNDELETETLTGKIVIAIRN